MTQTCPPLKKKGLTFLQIFFIETLNNPHNIYVISDLVRVNEVICFFSIFSEFSKVIGERYTPKRLKTPKNKKLPPTMSISNYSSTF